MLWMFGLLTIKNRKMDYTTALFFSLGLGFADILWYFFRGKKEGNPLRFYVGRGILKACICMLLLTIYVSSRS